MSKKDETDPIIEVQSSINDLKNQLKRQAAQLNPIVANINDPNNWFYPQWGPPVGPKEFIESEKYYGNKFHGQIWPWVIETMEQVFCGEYYAPKYNTVAIAGGKGSGKSYLMGVVDAYLWYWILSFKDFGSYIKSQGASFDKDAAISLLGMAPTKRQAKEIVFQNAAKFISKVQVFKDRKWLPKDDTKSELIYQDETGFNKLVIFPGNSSETVSLGYNIFGGIIDEADFWGQKTKDPVVEIYNEMNSRRKTRFNNMGMVMLISSAKVDGSFFNNFEVDAVKDPTIFFKRISTYDCNPMYITLPRYDLKVKVEKGDGKFVDKILRPPLAWAPLYEKDLANCLKDFDAIPPVAGSPFYKDVMLLMSKFNKDRVDPFPDLGQDISETPNDIVRRMPENFKGDPSATYRIHVDLAQGNMIKGQCGCGFAMVHKVTMPPPQFYKVVLDMGIRFKAPRDKEIQVSEVLALIRFLRDERHFNINYVTFDQYQSLQAIQTINAWGVGIQADKLAVGYKEHAYLKTLIYTGQFDFFEDSNLLFELKRLEDYGEEVDHGPASFKDEADAVAGACYSASALEASTSEAEVVEKPLPRASIVMTRRGGGGGAAPNPRTPGMYRNNPGYVAKYRRGF